MNVVNVLRVGFTGTSFPASSVIKFYFLT